MHSALRWMLVVALVPTAVAARSMPVVGRLAVPESSEDTRPNILVVLTDDQRWDSLWAMPFVQRKLADRGVKFTNVYATTPSCSPFRASFLSGGFLARETGVLTNRPPNGGVAAFFDERTLATILQEAGYRTGIVGKYMNRYSSIAPRVPPGWDQFTGVSLRKRNWYDFEATTGSSRQEATQGELREITGTYVNDFIFAEALDFLQEDDGRPFFLLVTPHAPHYPATPLPRDEDAFEDFEYRGRAYGEKNLNDKPASIRIEGCKFKHKREEQDEFFRDQLRSLLPVDRGVKAIYRLLAEQGKLDSTMLIYTSDNGMLWGEHRVFGKGQPYEEALRVPLVIVTHGIPPAVVDTAVAVNLDVPATIFDVADVFADSEQLAENTQGSSLLPLLESRADPANWNRELFIESYGYLWAGLMLPGESGSEPGLPFRWKYVERGEGSVEVYDLRADPYEQRSIHRQAGFANGPRLGLSQRLEAMKGLAIATLGLPAANLGRRYKVQLDTWGGKAPYVWDIVDGALPPGLSLDTESGRLAGRPTSKGRHRFSVRVRGSSVRRHSGMPQTFIRRYLIFVAKEDR